MLVGGSATEGTDSNRSYRCYLDGMLRQKGHRIDFVGSRHKHNDNKSEPDSYQFDSDHEGHSGKSFAWFAENMPVLLGQNTPDIVVLQLGAEDIAADIDSVIATLRVKNPSVKVVIAHPDKHAMSSASSPVVVANIGRDPNTKASSAEEAQKMAVILAEAISPLMPSKK